MKYGQFCPIAKATEILGEKWTFLIIRELLMGGRRFNELQRGLGDISPALLTARLKSFEADGLIVRRRINAQRGYVSCSVTPQRWQTDYQVLDGVTKKDGARRTRASFVVADGRPGAQRL